MRFVVSVVSKNGQPDTKRHMSSNTVRLDDGEEFRLLFENEWKTPGRVLYCFDGGEIYEVRSIGRGEIIPSAETFTYTYTKQGSGRPIDVMFQHPDNADDVRRIIAINNDYYRDGTVVQLGDPFSNETVSGRTVSREDDPDLHMRA